MTVYLNGAFLPLADAKIPVLDRGFIYGDGVYELIPVYQRAPFRLPQHLARLQRSLDGIRLANPHPDGGVGVDHRGAGRAASRSPIRASICR